MIERTVALIIVLAGLAGTPALNAQPSTEKLPNIKDVRARFGIDVGGTDGPLSPFEQSKDAPTWLDQTIALSYQLRGSERHAVRVVTSFVQAERVRMNDVGTPNETRQRTRERFATLGLTVDMLDKPLFGTGRNVVRAAAVIGSGVIPYVRRRFEYDSQIYPDYRIERGISGVGLQLAGSVGLRWRWLALDQHVWLLASTGGAVSERNALAPMTMGVRF